MRISMLSLAFVATSVLPTAVSAQVPPAIGAPGENTIVTFHAGPTWEHADGSAVVAKAAANAAGQTANDIPWLKLEVTAHRGAGLLSDVTTVQRINTRGGVHAGACDRAGALHSAPYAADYVFLRKGS